MGKTAPAAPRRPGTVDTASPRWARSRATASRGSRRLDERYKIVRGQTADRQRQPDTRAHLAAGRPPRELPDEFDQLGDARGRERMAARLESARRVDGQPAVERGLAVERGGPRAARGEE